MKWKEVGRLFQTNSYWYILFNWILVAKTLLTKLYTTYKREETQQHHKMLEMTMFETGDSSWCGMTAIL